MIFRRYNVFFFGLVEAGKTTFKNAYLNPDDFDPHHSPTGNNEAPSKNGWWFFGDFRFHDMGGLDKARSAYSSRLKNGNLAKYKKECPICVIVFDYKKYVSSDKDKIETRIGSDLRFIREHFGSGVPLFFVGTHKEDFPWGFYNAIKSSPRIFGKIQEFGFSLKIDRCRVFDLSSRDERYRVKTWFGDECDKCGY